MICNCIYSKLITDKMASKLLLEQSMTCPHNWSTGKWEMGVKWQQLTPAGVPTRTRNWNKMAIGTADSDGSEQTTVCSGSAGGGWNNQRQCCHSSHTHTRTLFHWHRLDYFRAGVIIIISSGKTAGRWHFSTVHCLLKQKGATSNSWGDSDSSNSNNSIFLCRN